ncbi:MAG: glycosyltransferase [Candidatus Omnitrophota bacterium]|jgi:hypothetical protein
MECRIIVLNYNGAELLPKCLPSVAEAAACARYPTRLTVLDNLSQDDGLTYVRENFPKVDIAVASANRCLCSYNDYLRTVSEPVVILLNNDIRVEKNFVDPLVEPFTRDSQGFLVAPCVRSFDGATVEAGRSYAGVKFGMFWCDARPSGYESEFAKPSETYSSGFGGVDRRKFLDLGGYDERYLPGIMEDVDLCTRARRAGYHLYYEPRSVVYHMGQASFKKRFGSRGIAVMAHRNNFLFMWKNFRSPWFWAAHLFFLPLRLVFSIVRGNRAFVKGFFQALRFRGRHEK